MKTNGKQITAKKIKRPVMISGLDGYWQISAINKDNGAVDFHEVGLPEDQWKDRARWCHIRDVVFPSGAAIVQSPEPISVYENDDNPWIICVPDSTMRRRH